LFTGRFFWRLFPLTILVTLGALAAIAILAGTTTRQEHLDSVENDLAARATMFAPLAKAALRGDTSEPIDTLCKSMGAQTGTRFTLILPSGRVVCDSSEDPEAMANHADRPEIRSALDGKAGTATRYSATVEKPLMYVAVPVRENGRLLGVARAAIPLDFIDRALGAFYLRMAYGGLAVAILSAALSFVIARRLSHPLEEMHRRTNELLSGISEEPLPIADSTEIGALADAVNRMALELDQRLQTTLRNNRELEAILATMVDGVLVTDARGAVVRTNEAARRLLGTESVAASSRGLDELIERILMSSTPVESELSLGGATVEARGLPLRDSYDRTTGALVVLTDKTRMKQLEAVRRDFAAHVSHELKTPITAVRGFADTLLSGALDEPDEARRFVGFIAEQGARLEGLVDGLMGLARIEQSAERRDLERAWHHLRPLLKSVVSSLENEARERNAAIEIDCPPDVAARVNAPLLERAVANLVDNALRYNDDSCRISIRVRDDEKRVTISVADDGKGISGFELDRLFERFYRVPSFRALNPQGLGLGLAIVKHIALAHGGNVHVSSEPGIGTTFEISIAKY
jgi:two-component system phosphate regulon sensor histidine kinase PhoR